MRILALDPGTKCGWARDLKRNGVWNLQPSRFDSAGRRFTKFRDFLIAAIVDVDMVVYEEVHYHMTVDSAQVHGGLVAVIQTVCLDHFVEYQGVNVQTIKKHAVKGNAKKEEMVRAASLFFPSVNIIDDNHADALCLLDYAQKHIK